MRVLASGALDLRSSALDPPSSALDFTGRPRRTPERHPKRPKMPKLAKTHVFLAILVGAQKP